MFYISYHNADLKRITRTVSLLKLFDNRVWFDRQEIGLFANWSQKINEAISVSDVAFIFLSVSYVNSTYCLKELAKLQSVGSKIVSLIIDDVQLSSVADLADFDESLDLRGYPDPAKIESRLKDLIVNITDRQRPVVVSERYNYVCNLINSIELKLQETTTNWAIHLQETDELLSERKYRPRGYFPQLLTRGAYSLSIDSEILVIENLISLLEVQPNNILQGLVGTGKSTIALLLALWGGHQYLSREDAPLPVYLNLSQWETNQSFEQFMASQWGLEYEWRAWLSRYPALFVIDVDDIAIRQHPDCQDRITELCIRPEQHSVVLIASEWSMDRNTLPLSLITTLPLDDRTIRQIANECLPELRAKKLLSLYELIGSDSNERQIDYISFLIEYLTVNTDDNLRTLPRHFGSHIIWNRWRQHISPIQLPISFEEFLSILKYLAFHMLQSETPYSLHYDEALNLVGDTALLEIAFDTGILKKVGDWLRFSARLIQTDLAAYMLLTDGIYKHLSKPKFDGEHLRIATKWDRVILSIFAITEDEQHHEIIETIDDIDPFLAIEFAQQNHDLFRRHRRSLIDKLIDVRSKNPDAHYALIRTLSSMPDVSQTAQSLLHLMTNSSWHKQQLLYELMMQLPFVVPDKIQTQVHEVDRNFDESRIALLSSYSVTRWICYLAFLAHHPDPRIQRNTICLLGDTKDTRVLPILFSLLKSFSNSIIQDLVLAMLNVTVDYGFVSRMLEIIPVDYNNPDIVVKMFEAMGREFSARLITILHIPENNYFRKFYITLSKVSETTVKDIVTGLITRLDNQDIDILPQEQLEDRNAMKLSDLVQRRLNQAQDKSTLDRLLTEITGVLTQSPASMPDKDVKAIKLLERTKSSIDHGRMTQNHVSEIVNIPIELKEKLVHNDWSIRYRALQELAGYSADEIIPRILSLAKDDRDIQVRIRALDILANLPVDQRINTVLLNALEDPEPIVIDAAVDSIKKLEHFETSRIITLLKHPNLNTVVAVIEILSVHHNPDAVKPLIDLLGDERKSANKELPIGFYAAKALSLIATPEALEAVKNSDFMNEPDEANVIPPAIEHGHDPAPKYTLEQKVRLTLLVMNGEKWEVAQKATRYLRNLAKSMRGSKNMQVISMLEEALKNERWTIRQAVTEALAWIQSPSSIPIIIPLLMDTNWMVQVAAIHALVELDAQDAAPHIADLLGDSNSAVAEAAAEALGSLQNPVVLEQLHISLGSDDEFVRLSALQSIYCILETNSTPILVEMLHDPYNHIRWFAIKYLSINPDPQALDEVAQLLPDTAGPAWEKNKINDYALLALKNMNTPESMSIIDGWLTQKRHKRGKQ